MLQDPIVKPPDVPMDISRAPAAPTDRRNKPNNCNPEQVLKCPRCDSMNTKFCYYNNYSLTQPRHFCKSCRRYWTQGGSLRNVPVGGGCRKNKRVKQRTVDPHTFGGLVEDHHNLAGGLLGGFHAGGGLLSSSFHGGAGGVPGYGDLMASCSDTHVLSMAFSRLQESLRLGDPQITGSSSLNPGAASLSNKLSLMSSNMHSTSPYDTGLVYTNANVKAEYGGPLMYNGSELGSLFDPVASSQLGSATATLATLEDQLSNFGVPMDHAFNTSNLDTHLKLQHQKLALQLGGATDHHMHADNIPATAGAAGSLEINRLGPHHGRHHEHVLPDFEDHESPESMTNMMNFRRSAGHAAASMKEKLLNMQGMDGRALVEENWASDAGHDDNQQQQATTALGDHKSQHLYEAVSSSAAEHQAQMSFWSQSPWSHDVVHSAAGSLL